MSKKQTMRIVGVVMMVVGIGIGGFGVFMRSSWSASSQVPKVYDWNNEELGQAPAVNTDDIDIVVGEDENVKSEDNTESSDSNDDADDESAENNEDNENTADGQEDE